MKKFARAALIMVMIGVTAASVSASNTGGPTGNGGAGAGAPTPPADSVPATPPEDGSGPMTDADVGTGTNNAEAPAVLPPPIYTGTNLGDKSPQRYNFRQIANELLPSVATWLASALGALAVLFLIWAGIQFLTAEGDPEKVGAATKTALYVIVGVVLVMFAYAMVYLFLSLFAPA